MMLARKDGLSEEVAHSSYLKPHSEWQEMSSSGIFLFPGEEICTFNKKMDP